MFINGSIRVHRINKRATAVNYSGFKKGPEGNPILFNWNDNIPGNLFCF
jgi:hypothetical protein